MLVSVHRARSGSDEAYAMPRWLFMLLLDIFDLSVALLHVPRGADLLTLRQVRGPGQQLYVSRVRLESQACSVKRKDPGR